MPAKALLRITFPPHVEVIGVTTNKTKVKLREVLLPLYFPRPKQETTAAFVEVVGEVPTEVDGEEAATISAGDYILLISGKHGGPRFRSMSTEKTSAPPSFLAALLAGATPESLAVAEGDEEEPELEDEDASADSDKKAAPIVKAKV